MTSGAKKALKIIASFALAGVLIYFAFRGIDWQEFIRDLESTRWEWILLFVLSAVAALLFRALCWQAMLKPLYPDIRLRRVWSANNVGNLTNAVIPASGELVRCAYVSGGPARYDAILGTELMERIWDTFAITLLAIIAILTGSDSISTFFYQHIWHPFVSDASALIWTGAVIAIIVLFVVASFRLRDRYKVMGKVADFFSGLAHGIKAFKDIRPFWRFLVYTILLWLMYLAMYMCIIRAIPALSALTLTDALFLAAVGNFASVIPVPGGLGAYHYLIALSLSGIYGLSWEIGILFATLQHELHAVVLILLGILSYFKLNIKKP